MNFRQIEISAFAPHDSHWRGICFAAIGREFRMNMRGIFEYKDSMKAFCREWGGSWDAINKCWYVPAKGDFLKRLPSILPDALHAFGEGMMLGGEIQWCVAPSKKGDRRLEEYLDQVFSLLARPALEVVDGGQDPVSRSADAAGLSKEEAREVRSAFLSKESEASFMKRCEAFLGIDPLRIEIMATVLEAARYLDGKIFYGEKWEASCSALRLNLMKLVELIDNHQ